MTTLDLKNFSQRINELLSIHTPIIWVVTREEAIAEKAVVREVMRTNSAQHFYYCDDNGGFQMDPFSLKPSTAQVVADNDNGPMEFGNESYGGDFEGYPPTIMLSSAFKLLQDAPDNICLILRDTHELFGRPEPQRAFVDIFLREHRKEGVQHSVVVITPENEVPTQLADITELVELPLMDEKENLVMVAKWAKQNGHPLTKAEAYMAGRCATGLTTTQVEHALADGVHRTGKVDMKIINDTRIQAIKRSSVLTYIEPKKTLDDIGGHEKLKDWIREVKACMTPEAEMAHVKPSKGYVSVGQAGTGKTAMAEAVANELGVPFIIFDLSKVMGGIVGQSETTTRRAFETIKAIGSCVVLVDEIDKQLAGVGKDSHSVADGGTIMRVFDVILQNLQNNAGQFYILTANNIEKLPAPLMRSGRVDRKWYFSFPSEEERKDIFNIYFKQAEKDVKASVVSYAARMADHFTGAEIETAVNNMVRIGFLDHSPITSDVAMRGIEEVSSIWRNNREEVDKLFEYAQKNNIPATSSGEGKKIVMDERAKRRCAVMASAMDDDSEDDTAEGM